MNDTHLARVLRVAGDVTTHTSIDLSDLNHILAIDVANKRCVAEPGVAFRDLVRATLAHGLAPRVVETTTIKDAVEGFRVGGFHDGCVEYEVVTGHGDVVRCSREHDRELFEMMHGTHGTLGIITELTFDLIEAKPFVKVERRTFSTWRDLHAAMRQAASDPENDFVDAIVHAKRELVLCTGRFTNGEGHVRTLDYLFRHDRQPRFFDRILGKLQKNLFIPDDAADAFYEWYEDAVAHYPLAIVPHRMARRHPSIRHAAPGMYLDFAIRGAPGRLSKQLEELTFAAKGIHEGERIHDSDRYARVKRRMDPNGQLPNTAREAARPSMPARKQPPTVSPKLVAAKR